MNVSNKSDLFLDVIQTHKGILYKIANSYCKELEDRKDLIQEIIIQLWKSFDNYNHKYEYSTWIYKISLNVAISFYRKESKRMNNNNLNSSGILLLEVDEVNAKEEEIGLLLKFIQELKELERALMLLYLEEKSYKEISVIIGISQTNVATKINRIKNVLKKRFYQVNNN